ncbi:MAG: T9SS type A sorting domain-containing protein, partial [Ignavibacteria bacterium]
AYPNPFNPSTNIKFELPQNGFVKLIIYDAAGREINTLVNENKIAGTYTEKFDGTGLASGIYFYKIEVISTSSADIEFKETGKLVLIK